MALAQNYNEQPIETDWCQIAERTHLPAHAALCEAQSATGASSKQSSVASGDGEGASPCCETCDCSPGVFRPAYSDERLARFGANTGSTLPNGPSVGGHSFKNKPLVMEGVTLGAPRFQTGAGAFTPQ